MKLGFDNYCKQQTSLAFTDMEGSGAVGAATGPAEELNLQPHEAKPARKPSTAQPKAGDSHTFPPAREGDSHDRGRSPGDSVQFQQPAVPGCSSQKEASQPAAGYSQEGEQSERVAQHQNDVRECIAMVAAEG